MDVPNEHVLAEKSKKLEEILRGYGSVLVCFSGGVDSTLLLYAAQRALGDRCFAMSAVSETMAAREISDARKLGQELGLGERHRVVTSNELEREGFAQNPTDRCFHCKSELLDLATPLATELGAAAICIGTNLDDLGDHRPGLLAADQRGAKQPMVEAGLTKADVRALSKRAGLRTWDKPQLACLSSRFPYGTEITPERLRRVDQFEDGLRDLGFKQMRVRFHDSIARLEIEVGELERACQPEIRDQIVKLGKAQGFSYVALDLAGFRSGSLNESLEHNKVIAAAHPVLQIGLPRSRQQA